MNGDPHICQCKHCGRLLNPPQINFQPAPTPPECQHEWAGVSTWSATDGEHGS